MVKTTIANIRLAPQAGKYIFVLIDGLELRVNRVIKTLGQGAAMLRRQEVTFNSGISTAHVRVWVSGRVALK